MLLQLSAVADPGSFRRVEDVNLLFGQIFPENGMKVKEIGPGGGGQWSGFISCKYMRTTVQECVCAAVLKLLACVASGGPTSIDKFLTWSCNRAVSVSVLYLFRK